MTETLQQRTLTFELDQKIDEFNRKLIKRVPVMKFLTGAEIKNINFHTGSAWEFLSDFRPETRWEVASPKCQD